MTTMTNNGTVAMRRDNGGGQERLLPPEGLSYSNAAVSWQCTHSSNIHVGLESGESRYCFAGTTTVFGAQKIRNLTHCSVELHPICLPVIWPVFVSYRPLSVGIFGMVLLHKPICLPLA